VTARDDVLRALEELGGRATPAQLAAATGTPPRTVTYALGQLRAGGLVEGPRPCPRLSPAARARARLPAPVAEGEFDEAVEAIFGSSPALSAFARLSADLIVARQLYPGRSFYPALFAYGELSGTGKTALAQLLADALDLAEAVVVMGHKAPGEVVGRRVALDGSRYRFEPAEHLAFPFLCLDELGDADADVRRHARALCHGEPVVTIEGSRVELRATVMATWNPSGATVFGEAYLRRALVLCADAPSVRIADLARRLHDAELAGTGRGSLRPSDLRPAVAALSDEVFGVLEGAFEALTDVGRARVDRRVLELATLGRAARHRLGDGDELKGVAYFAAMDLLIVTETVPGLVEDDWSVELERAVASWADVPGLAQLATVAARRVELRKTVTAAVSERRTLEARDDLELTGARAKLRAIFDEAHKAILQVPPAHRPSAAELRAKLRQLRDAAGDARSLPRLDELVALGRPVIEQARQLGEALEHERTRAEQEKTERQAQATMAIAERKRQDEARRVALAADGQRQKQIRASAAAALNEWRPVVRRLERLYGRTSTRASERADVILAGYRLPDGSPLLQWRQDPPPPPAAGALEKLGHFLSYAGEPRGRWVSAWDESVAFSATAGGCPALRQWGANTRRMIAPLLKSLSGPYLAQSFRPK